MLAVSNRFIFTDMQNPAKLSKQQLLDLVNEQANVLAQKDKQLLIKDDTVKQLEAKLDAKEKAYLKLWQERFGAKSERYIADPDQLKIDFGDTPESVDAADGLHEAIEEADLIPAHKRRKPKKKHQGLPAHFPREVAIIDVQEAAKTCDIHGEKQLLPESMWDVREKLIAIPASYTVLVRKYKKYACPGQPACGIASPERPTGIVEGDKYDTSVAAQIISHKYALSSSALSPARHVCRQRLDTFSQHDAQYPDRLSLCRRAIVGLLSENADGRFDCCLRRHGHDAAVPESTSRV